MNIKLVIWDLDDTLWRGVLAEGDAVSLFEHRAEFVRALNRCGIVSSICSKNDGESARRALEEMGLWDQFVFPRIAFMPKAPEIRQIIQDMQLRPSDALFVDDNVRNLEEARYLLPELNVVNASQPECDQLFDRIWNDNKHIAKSRIQEYRLLQTKLEDRRAQPGSNEDFLRSCNIRVTFSYQMDNLTFCERIEDLINRTNQLNYTRSRVESGSMEATIVDIANFYTCSVFVWDRYGYYGLAGLVMVNRPTSKVVHFLFSCRVMHMGIERFVLDKLKHTHPQLDLSRIQLDLPLMTPDWITEEPFVGPSVRARLLGKATSGAKRQSTLRIMCDCQSGGLAHFSRWRDLADFDNWPHLFKLNMFLTDAYASQDYPPMLAYGAGIDYRDEVWPDSILNKAIYQLCATRFCSFLKSLGCKLLVILPPDNAPEYKYLSTIHPGRTIFTRERAVEFNSVWRECEMNHPNVTVLDLSPLISGPDMNDISHYHAKFLKTIASHIDHWYESEADAALQA
jgi:FkbH-like protein